MVVVGDLYVGGFYSTEYSNSVYLYLGTNGLGTVNLLLKLDDGEVKSATNETIINVIAESAKDLENYKDLKSFGKLQEVIRFSKLTEGNVNQIKRTVGIG